MVLRARPWPIRCSFCALIISMLAMANSASASSSFFSSLLSQMQSLRVGMQGERAEPSEEQPPAVELDFSEVDGAFQSFIDESAVFDGISYVVVDANATLHTETFGDHTEDLVVMLASTSKVPAVMTLLALHEDPDVAFSVDQPVSTMLPYEGVYTDRTIVQMVSNTSGMPGLQALTSYGNPFGQTLEDLNHLCTFAASDFVEFEACGQQLLTNELAASQPAGTSFDYGGSQWQAAGVTAAIAGNATWNQLVDEYLVVPCGLEVFTFGNPWQELNLGISSFNGTVESLPGQSNPHIGGGAITNLADYAKLLQVHLNGGFCGDQQVLSQAALDRMRVDRGGVVSINPTPYGMGWWISSDNPGVYDDPGAFGAISFIDVERGIGGYIAIDDYSRDDAGAPVSLVRETIIPLIQTVIDGG
jgi:CubicO group peptidase (beta-lactamase class C family)